MLLEYPLPNHVSTEIRDDTGYTPELRLLDLQKFSSVIAFADAFEKEDARLDILVANAAIGTNVYKQTGDGWEKTYVHPHLHTYV